ncbi:FecR family protein [Phenylobacterium koreense]|uniref:Transmembrane sensor n=1 Tax=Phenylobacterium koreense TaxID=266125 RepID=A0ABV2EMA0_9CAUL
MALAALSFAAVALIIVMATRGPAYSTDVGAQQVVRLEDGSVVRLNTDSKVRVRYGQHVRRLVLERGQAYFEVAHDGGRPFVVEAGDAQVRALGTKFDVQRTEGKTRVTLVEGRVEVARAGTPSAWTLKPNEQITLGEAAPRPGPADVPQATSWTIGRLRFLDTPLVKAVDEVNRYSRTKIVLDAGDVAQVRINGAFETGDTAAFVSAVTELFGLTAARTDDRIVLRADAAARGGKNSTPGSSQSEGLARLPG